MKFGLIMKHRSIWPVAWLCQSLGVSRSGFHALLHHSDRSSQYISDQFQWLMADNCVVCSASRSGNVRDNATMESFFLSLNRERIGKKIYWTRDDARAEMFDDIERLAGRATPSSS